jgi:hypothetical protein
MTVSVISDNPPINIAALAPGRAGGTERSDAGRDGPSGASGASGAADKGSAARPDEALQSRPNGTDGEPLSDSEMRQVRELERRDREVRDHEKAHASVGGPYAGSPSYDYQRGPDGERYAVGGRVSIDYGPVRGDPEATIEKMKTVIAAALAPAEPSSKDLQIASQARQNLLEARLEADRMKDEMDSARGSAGGVAASPA